MIQLLACWLLVQHTKPHSSQKTSNHFCGQAGMGSCNVRVHFKKSYVDPLAAAACLQTRAIGILSAVARSSVKSCKKALSLFGNINKTNVQFSCTAACC
jgi:hypothetical protein